MFRSILSSRLNRCCTSLVRQNVGPLTRIQTPCNSLTTRFISTRIPKTSSLLTTTFTVQQWVPQRSMAFGQASFLRKPRRSFPVRAPHTAKIRQEASERWLPAARGNLKRQRSFSRHLMTPKSSRQKSRYKKPVYATRKQLRKLKKILPHDFDYRRRVQAFVPFREGKAIRR